MNHDDDSPVTLRPIGAGTREAAAAERLRTLAYWLDDRFRVPGTNWRFGMDGLMGLLPGIGDLAAMANKRNRRLMIEHLERGEL